MAARRTAAIASLAFLAFALVAAAAIAVRHFPHGLVALTATAAALAAAWAGLLARGVVRAIALAAAVLLLGGAVAYAVAGGSGALEDLAVLGALAISLAAARRAFGVRADLRPADRPRHPVLIYNPKSGGGKAERFHVADEARARGIEPRELRPGDDLRAVVRAAVADGADALAMAGGDGSQAIVAAEAARLGLPYACIPSGTRNHFALDLGVDRDDVVGALDAFVDGRERVVDLAEVNGRVFVNNVSLGVYAEAVEQAGYRDAKIRTLLATAPRALGPDADGDGFRWTSVHGDERRGAAVLMVSNDPYRLGRALGSGTRPRLDTGELGITAVELGRPPRVEEWSANAFEVRAASAVPVGIDGETVKLQPPLVFRSRPHALRVRIAPQHPGASPSAAMPASPWHALQALAAIARSGVAQ